MTTRDGGRLSSVDFNPRLDPAFDRIARRIVSPLTGLSRTLGFMMRGRGEPRVIVSGAQLTGVETLLGRKSGLTYHIGGCGVFTEEAVIRSAGETVERYAQVVKPLTHGFEAEFATESELRASGREPLVGAFARPFLPEQYAQEGFAYAPLGQEDPITWTPTRSLLDGERYWVPAQLLYIGYQLRNKEGEPWLNSAVTTGSAAHTSYELALRSALLELVHGDAAMGHWYTGRVAPLIRLGKRTAALNDLLERYGYSPEVRPDFHRLQLPGFDFHVSACVMRARPGSGRGSCLGLGIASNLEESLYKAFLEAAAGVQLSKMLRISPELVDGAASARNTDTKKMFDLDANVAHYARAEGSAFLDVKFSLGETVSVEDLPDDGSSDPGEDVERVVEGYRSMGASLVGVDCTTPEANQLGFRVPRVWSPDTLSLCLPSAPPLNHPRFAAYGHPDRDVRPHPYA